MSVAQRKGLLFKKPEDSRLWLMTLTDGGYPEFNTLDDSDSLYKDLGPYDADIVTVDDIGKEVGLVTLKVIRGLLFQNGDRRVTVWEAVNFAMDTELGVLSKLINGELGPL